MVTLVFVAVLLAAFALDLWFIQPWEAKHRPKSTVHGDAALEIVVPRTLFFHPGHTWARLDHDGQVTVGVDDLARTVIGDLSAVELPAIGQRLKAGEAALGSRQGVRRLRFAAPVSGTVTEVNAALGRDPVRLRWRPYKEGWAFRLAPDDRLSAELGSLAIGREAERWMAAEMERLRDLFACELLTGPLEGSLQKAGDDAWALVQHNILRLDGATQEVVS